MNFTCHVCIVAKIFEKDYPVLKKSSLHLFLKFSPKIDSKLNY